MDELNIGSAVSAEIQRYIDANVGIDRETLDAAIDEALEGLPTNGTVDPMASSPVTYGANPDGSNDASPAFAEAAKTGCIYIQAGARFTLESTVQLPQRCRIVGPGPSHFGNGNTQVLRGKNLPESAWMLTNAWHIEGVSFGANGNKGPGVLMEGYCCRTLTSSFDGFTVAQGCPGGSVNRFRDNQYTGCDYGIYNTQEGGSPITTTYYEGNHFQYVTNAIYSPNGRFFTCTFRDNVFERVAGDAIAIEFMRDCTISGNWWEHRHTGEEGKANFTIGQPQQCWGNVVSGSHTQAGWIDYFQLKPEEMNGMAGGLTYAGETLQHSDNTDGGWRIDKQGLHALVAPWGNGSGSFDVESGRASGAGKSQRLRLRSRYKVELSSGRGIDFTGHEIDQEDGSMRYPIRVRNGEDTYHSLGLNYGAQGVVKPQLAGLATVKGKDALIGVPAHAYVTNGDDAVGMGLFSAVEFTDTSVKLTLPFPIEMPMIQITTVDGSSHSGITIGSDGFTIAFDDGVPPFWLSFMSIPKGMA